MKKTVILLMAFIYTLITLDVVSQDTGSESALSFLGNSTRVDIPDVPAFNFGSGNFTFEFWINVPSAPASVYYPYTQNDGPGNVSWGMFSGVLGAGTITSSICSGAVCYSATSTTNITGGQWHHVAGTRNGTNLEIYVDGVLENTTSVGANAVNNPSTPLTLGHEAVGNSFIGQIDEVRIWNVARTQAQIRTAMCQSLVGNETGLIGYWDINEGTGGVIDDLTSNNNDGTLAP